MRDEQDAAVTLGAEPVHPVGDDAQRVDVQAGVGLVEDREARVEQFHLEDLVALLLSTGEALIDVALRERRVDRERAHRLLDLTGPGPQLRRLTGDGGLGRTEEVRHRDAGHLDGVLHREEHSGPGALVDGHRQDVGTVQRDGAVRDLVLRVPGDGVRQRGLARPVRAHDRVRLAGIDGQVDAAQDLLGAGLGLDGHVQVTDLE